MLPQYTIVVLPALTWGHGGQSGDRRRIFTHGPRGPSRGR